MSGGIDGAGRSLSEDPRPSVNPYVYVGNNPISLNDPSGKMLIEDVLIYTVTDEGEVVLLAEEVTLTENHRRRRPDSFRR